LATFGTDYCYLSRKTVHINYSRKKPFFRQKPVKIAEIVIITLTPAIVPQREEVSVVRRPDRKELLAYLKGTDAQVCFP
jgi:hypothetical protein